MKDDIAQALLQAQAAPPPPPQAAPNPFILNQSLEQAAAPQRPPLHPLVAAIMQRLGLMNMIRNQGNAAMMAGDQP